jgi:hypothetical protein
MDDDMKENLTEILKKMEDLSRQFYAGARLAGYHQFLEHNGFLVKQIEICRRLLLRDVDFVANALELTTHDAAYLAEKFGCMYGQALHEPATMRAFLVSLFHEASLDIRNISGILMESPPRPDPDSMGAQARKRPADFDKLSAREQWEIDKTLGLLDWVGARG